LAYSKPFPIKDDKDYFGASAPRLGLGLVFLVDILLGLALFLTSSFSLCLAGELF